MTFDVYGIGNAIMDLQVQAAEEDLTRFSLTKASMRLVEVEEQQRLIDYFSGSRTTSGGSAANSMIAVAQLGGKAAYGCMVGDDSYGSLYFEEMRSLGIELHTVAQKGERTGTSVILITPDAERTMNTHLGASSLFSAEHVSEELLASAKWLYVEGYLFSSERGQAAAKQAIELAKRHGVQVAITFSDGFIVEFFQEPVRAAIAKADLVFANVHEAKTFTGQAEEESAFTQLCSEVPGVVMTKSERGVTLRFDGARFDVDAFQTKAIDDTGAGDMFAGAFLYGITHNRSAYEAAELACFLSSKVVSQFGARLQEDVQALSRGPLR